MGEAERLDDIAVLIACYPSITTEEAEAELQELSEIDPQWFRRIGRLSALVRAARLAGAKEALEEQAKVECPRCRNGEPARVEPGIARGWYPHHTVGNRVLKCYAASIQAALSRLRSSSSEPEKEKP